MHSKSHFQVDLRLSVRATIIVLQSPLPCAEIGSRKKSDVRTIQRCNFSINF